MSDERRTDLDRILSRHVQIPSDLAEQHHPEIAHLPEPLQRQERARAVANVPEEVLSRYTRVGREEGRILLRDELEAQLGAPLREDGGGISNFGQRFRLVGGGRRDNEDRLDLIKRYIPGAEVRTITLPDGSDTVVFRRPDRDDFEFINPPGFDRGDLGAASSYLFNLEMGLGIAASIGTRGMSFPIRTVAASLSAGLGRGVDIGIDTAMGDRPPPVEDILGDVALSAVFGAGGEIAGTALTRGANLVRGEGLVRLQPGAAAAVAAAREHDLVRPTMGQLHQFPARREGQAAVTSEVPFRRYADQQATVRERLASWSEELTDQQLSPALTDRELQLLVERQTLALRETIDSRNVSLRKGKDALRNGLREFEVSSREWIDRKYERAIELADQDVTFDISPVREIYSGILTGVRAPARDAPGETIRANRRPGGDLRDIINRLHQIDDTLHGSEGFRALKAIRTELNDIRSGDMRSADGNARQDMRNAGLLYEAINNVIENAEGPGRGVLQSPYVPPAGQSALPTEAGYTAYDDIIQTQTSDFSRAWRAANTSNAWRERMLELEFLQNISNENMNPDRLVMLYMRPGEFRTLRRVKRLMPEESWNEFVASYETRLLARPKDIVAELDSFATEPEALRLVMSPERQLEFRALGRSAERISQSENVLFRQADEGRRLLELVDAGNSARVAEIVEFSGGPDSPMGRLFRAGIIENILDKATYINPVIDLPALDPGIASRVIDDYLRSGALNSVLTESDRLALTQYRAYLNRIDVSSDAGGFISGAGVAGQAFDILNPKRAAAGVLSQGQNAVLARIFTSQRAARLVFGTGEDIAPRHSIRTASTVGAIIARDLTQQQAELFGAQVANYLEENYLEENQ